MMMKIVETKMNLLFKINIILRYEQSQERYIDLLQIKITVNDKFHRRNKIRRNSNSNNCWENR